MDDFRNVKAVQERKSSRNEEIEEQSEEEEQTLDEMFPTGTDFDQSDYHHLQTGKGLDQYIGSPSSSSIPTIPESGEEESLESESGAIEIFSDQSEPSVKSAGEKEVPEFQEAEESLIEHFGSYKVGSEQKSGSEVEFVEDEIEQTSGVLEEIEEEADEEEEEEEEVPLELEMKQKFAKFENVVEEVLSIKFPEADPVSVAELKLQVYEKLMKHLDKEDKEIDTMLKVAYKTGNKIQMIKKALQFLAPYNEKYLAAYEKIEEASSELFGGEEEEEEEEEDVEDEQRSRAAEMAKEILEADDIESVESVGKVSSVDSNISAMLAELADDLKESEPEIENEEKKPKKKKKKGQNIRKSLNKK